MKNCLFILLLLPILGFTQLKKQKVFSFDYSSGYYSNFKEWKENGLSGGFSFSYKSKYTYSSDLTFGFGISKNSNNFNGYVQAFFESDLLIGKEVNFSNSIAIQPEIGIGYLYYSNHFQEEAKNLIGIPVKIKILFFNNKNVAFGLIPKITFNNVQNNYVLFFTINFKF